MKVRKVNANNLKVIKAIVATVVIKIKVKSNIYNVSFIIIKQIKSREVKSIYNYI